jgi:hypothetical protein
MHLVHMAGENPPSPGGEPERGQGVRRSAYHVSSAQNAWQDSRLAAAGISALSLWNLSGLICNLINDLAVDIWLFTSEHRC